jgi:hypothetical protein
MHDMTSLLVVTAREAVLPSATEVQPATLEIDVATGKIKKVHRGIKRYEEYPSLPSESFIQLEEGQLLLPGLVDAVCSDALIAWNTAEAFRLNLSAWYDLIVNISGQH